MSSESKRAAMSSESKRDPTVLVRSVGDFLASSGDSVYSVSPLTATSTRDVELSAYPSRNGKQGIPQKSKTGLILRPAASRDPRDPLNLTKTRKIVAVFFLCFFGAMAAAAELILGAMLPVFVLQYVGIDPKTIVGFIDIDLPPGTNPLALLALIPGGPAIWKVYLLGSLPVLIIGLANLFNIPLATAIGRRPVMIICGCIAVIGAVWAGHSQSLDSHLGARCVQAVGAGTVESLIPFVIADLTHEHERNTWMSFVFATQGLIIVGLGFATPTIIINLSWRWMYFITASGAGFFLIGVIAFLPETRWKRTTDEIHGIPRDDTTLDYPPRTWKDDLGMFRDKPDWKHGVTVFLDALRTMFYPQILIITLISSGMISATLAAGYTAAPPLIVRPWKWPFYHLTLCLVPILLASFGTVLVTGPVADAVTKWSARRRGRDRVLPEDQLLNLIIPVLCGLVGTILYGEAGGDPERYPWVMFLAGLGLMAFAFFGTNTVCTVYILEVYPEMAGSALLNIASIRYIFAFFMSFQIATWVVDLGYAKSFQIYTIIIAVCAALLPALWWYGPAWKRMFPGRKSQL